MKTAAALMLPEHKDSILHAYNDDIFGVLGLHQWSKDTFVLRAFLPGADKVVAIDPLSDKAIVELEAYGDGVFAAIVKKSERFVYQWRVHYGDHVEIQEDPYRFGAQLSETDLYLFGEGTHEQLYRVLGAHLSEIEGVKGTRFCVWAPNARRVSVVGQFNHWDGRRHMMRKYVPSGVWEIFIPNVGAGDLYKYEIQTPSGEVLPQKADPYGFAAQLPPETASRVVDLDHYTWSDMVWMNKRGAYHHRESAVSIYEVHLGSWRRIPEEGDRFLTYRELADQLIPYVRSLNFTHIQLMPISEFPFDGSWGYQPVGLYAPTSRFGSPSDFKYFIDCCHQADLGVLIDWVPGHFPSDAHGLAHFDGTPLFEHADHRQGFHPDWNTFIFNYGRHEVANYLFANALFWLQEYHIDGLRVDAVASMLYLDYSREQGEWVPNQFGGRENLEAIDLLKRVNQKVYERFPDIMTVAEESTAWPGVSHPVYAGGLGFGFKWNMGWMNDTLRYIEKNPIHRQYHHHDLTFSLIYAFNENFILPLSHDEVVHGKRSLLGKMPGNAYEQFANLRAYYAYMWSHPGKKLLFMGCEFGQGQEWNHDHSLDWHQLDLPEHRGIQHLIRDLNAMYVHRPALYQSDCDGNGFEWIEADDRHNSVFSYIRSIKGAAPLVIVINMTPVAREAYRLGVSAEGYYKEIINTDASCYGGSDRGNEGGVHTHNTPSHGRNVSIDIVLPPLATVVFELQA